MSKKFNYVYKTTNLINGKIYIGRHSTNNLDDNYLGSGRFIRIAFDKYGKENFKREILEFNDNLEELYLLEEKLIKELNSTNIKIGYNCSLKSNGGVVWKGNHPNLGKKFPHSEEWRKNQSLKMKGESNKMFGKTHSEDVRRIISEKLTGHKHSEEFKINISKRFKGIKKSKEHVEKLTGVNNHFYGKHHTEETRKIISEKRIGIKLSDEHKLKISNKTSGSMNPNFGKKMSDEQKLKISETKKNSPLIFCPHCNKSSINKAMMLRWHFDNCKHKNN